MQKYIVVDKNIYAREAPCGVWPSVDLNTLLSYPWTVTR